MLSGRARQMVIQEAAAAGQELPDRRVTERVARFLPGLRMLVLGLTSVVPGQARVVQLSGRYRGTIRDSGLQ